ncbi:hypothetical protein CK501_04245 [Halovibrio salipaludis]|uniref:Transcriptional regulator AbiEi antitoxin N-terminal domain-containing protein n=2 Tax=Halovibrio salipaludis TaxID=2032626 RepID=A0A2A2FD24_9GAMM|nr:hypothetical protein CK501_04245 [Halovibrio salipaludis]
MAIQNSEKLNHLGHLLPEGLLVDAAWLEKQSYSRALRSQYVASGWLEQPVRGVFRRPRGEVSWEQAVISLQTLLEYPVSVGGRTALELQGYAHYLPYAQLQVHLYSDAKLPGWVYKLPIEPELVVHNRQRFLPAVEVPSWATSLTESSAGGGNALPGGLRISPWGHWNWPLIVSTPERAFLEYLDELPNRATFHMADTFMEGLGNLRPRHLQPLLEATRSIKVKRLFFFFADRQRHAWLKWIDRSRIDLGSGKRMLVKGGVLDPAYQITVPAEFAREEGNGISRSISPSG